MSGIVEFDVNEFKVLYPSIKLTDEQLINCFAKAEINLNNTHCSHVESLKERKILLYLLTAHYAVLQSRIESGNDAVGRVSSATEGSVSASFDYGQVSQSAAWYLQTPYGAEYWSMTKKYRSFLYVITQLPMPVDRNRR